MVYDTFQLKMSCEEEKVKKEKKKKKRTDQDRCLRRRAVIFKPGRIRLVLVEGLLDEGAAESDDGDATHDDDEGEPLVEVQAAVEKHDGEDADEEDERAAGHLEDRDGCIEEADVHQLYMGCGFAGGEGSAGKGENESVRIRSLIEVCFVRPVRCVSNGGGGKGAEKEVEKIGKKEDRQGRGEATKTKVGRETYGGSRQIA